MQIDWAQLAIRLNCENSGGTCYAQQALSEILGEDAIIKAVEHYISHGAGSELARSVLWHIHPKAGIEYCYKIFREDKDIWRRQMAVELLRVVADGSALKWGLEFLDDPDPNIQAYGAGLVDQLLWSHHVETDDCREILKVMANHPNLMVKERYDFIQQYLADRNSDRE